MAIGFMLVIIVCMLVSIATLNITTTQDTVSERDAYIQAKSALNFAESFYFSNNSSQLPGGVDSSRSATTTALLTFNTSSSQTSVSEGASVITIYDAAGTDNTSMLESYQEDALSTGANTYVYVQYNGQACSLVLTAVASMDGSDGKYELSKEYTITDGASSSTSSFTGNISYESDSSSRYLRIHVRPYSVSDVTEMPLIWVWAETQAANVDSDGNVVNTQAHYTNSIVNHLTGANNGDSGLTNPTFTSSDGAAMEWDRSLGPNTTMDYEGNGWYIYTIEMPAYDNTTDSSYNFTTVDIIIAKEGSLRSNGYDEQTWEIYGIPVPTESGEANGVDVYFTMNQSYYQDAQTSGSDGNAPYLDGSSTLTQSNINSYGSSDSDDMNRWYQNIVQRLYGGRDSSSSDDGLNAFSQLTSKYYSVYTKQQETILHFRQVYEDSDYDSTGVKSPSNPSGFSTDYEGYGWYRYYENSLLTSVTVGGNTFTLDSSYNISESEYGGDGETVREAFIVTNGTDWKIFTTEEEANKQLYLWGDQKAADYVTIYAQGDQQPVDSTVTTKLTYEGTYIDSDIELPEPDSDTWGASQNTNALLYDTGNECVNATPDSATAASDYYIGGSMFEGDSYTEAMTVNGSVYEWSTTLMPGSYSYSVYASDKSTVAASGSFDISYKSDITIRYNTSTNAAEVVNNTTSGDIVSFVYVGFYYGALSGSGSSFDTTTWSDIYVNYVDVNSSTGCIKLNTSCANDGVIWAKVPDNTDYLYFSNMSPAHSGDSDYERTADISSIDETFYYPISNSSGKWTLGDSGTYRSLMVSANSTGDETVTMVYSGTNKVAYYDIPIVDLLDAMADAASGSGAWLFSDCYWPSGYRVDGTKYYFSESQYVKYQGMIFYYTSFTGSYSALIANNGGANIGTLWEGQVSLTDGSLTGQDYRVGGTYTSSGKYYDGTSSPYSYTSTYSGGYVPNWYTYKIPAYSTYTLKALTGVKSSKTSDDVISTDTTFTAVGSSDYINQPIYLYYDNSSGTGTLEAYTFDNKLYSIDTNSSRQDTIYFNLPSTESWGKVTVYAEGINNKSATSDLSIDSTNGDNSYYYYRYTTGEYCFFTFYDGDAYSSGAEAKAAGATTYYFTGEENSNNEFRILADYSSGEMAYFLHPRTAALYAKNEAYKAYRASTLTTYDSSGGSTTITLAAASSAYSNASSYYNSGSRSSYTSSGSADYSAIASAASAIQGAITKARVYLDGFSYDTYSYSFPVEGAYKDDLVVYTKGSLYTLAKVYEEALNLYSDSSASASTLSAAATKITDTIANMNYTIAADAIQIIVSDTTAIWGENAVLWGYDSTTATWENTGKSLLSTTQANYYAFLFKNDTTLSSYSFFTITNGSYPSITDFDDALSNNLVISTLSDGSRWNFYTDTQQWEEDKSLSTYTLDATAISYSDATAVYSEIATPRTGKEFNLYVEYDCEVTYSGGTYTIFAGQYRISNSTYSGFSTDLASSGTVGIDLFTSTAENFFNTQNGYLDMADDYSTSDYKDNVPSSGVNTGTGSKSGTTDIMSKGISSTVNVTNDIVNFRYDNTSSSTGLVLTNTVTLNGNDKVTVALKELDVSSYGSDSDCFVINASSVTFYTDVIVTYGSGSGDYYTIERGTYSVSGTGTATIDLSDPNWTDDWVKLSEYNGPISGGTYVKN